MRDSEIWSVHAIDLHRAFESEPEGLLFMQKKAIERRLLSLSRTNRVKNAAAIQFYENQIKAMYARRFHLNHSITTGGEPARSTSGSAVMTAGLLRDASRQSSLMSSAPVSPFHVTTGTDGANSSLLAGLSGTEAALATLSSRLRAVDQSFASTPQLISLEVEITQAADQLGALEALVEGYRDAIRRSQPRLVCDGSAIAEMP